jgi:hypothetical protein
MRLGKFNPPRSTYIQPLPERPIDRGFHLTMHPQIHPACSPCLRSHAHALRTAQRTKTAPPTLLCTWADQELAADVSDQADVEANRFMRAQLPAVQEGGVNVDDIKVHRDHNGIPVKGPVQKKGRESEKEKEMRREAEVESLKMRIGEQPWCLLSDG